MFGLVAIFFLAPYDENHEKSCFSSFFQLILGQNPFKNLPTIALIILHQSGPPPTTPAPFSNFFPIFMILNIFPTPGPTLAAPCFLFLEGISPQDLQIRIKRRELVLKAARISKFIHWHLTGERSMQNPAKIVNFWLCTVTLFSKIKMHI